MIESACSGSGREPPPEAPGLSTLDEELKSLDLSDDQPDTAAEASEESASSAAEAPSVAVVEPDAIVLSGRQQGMLSYMPMLL